jgi:hypothetical protein
VEELLFRMRNTIFNFMLSVELQQRTSDTLITRKPLTSDRGRAPRELEPVRNHEEYF